MAANKQLRKATAAALFFMRQPDNSRWLSLLGALVSLPRSPAAQASREQAQQAHLVE